MKIQKLLISLAILLVIPFVVGASNDVTLTTATAISVGGHTINISGSSAVVDSITVTATNFSFVLSTDSTITVSSADGVILSTDAAIAYIVSSECSGPRHTLKHSSSAAGTVTVTVTPASNYCPSGSGGSGGGSSSGGSSSGGGGGSTTTVTPTVVAPVLNVAVTANQSFFTHRLAVGSTGDEVRSLQTRLLGEGFFSGEVTGYFGPITQAAVKAYQAKYGIDQLGMVGPATRAQLNKVFMANEKSNATATSQLTPAQISAITAQISALLQQVQVLQAKLKTLGN